MDILVSEPNGPYDCQLNTGAMDVEIKHAYLGLTLVSDTGERLSICMRDDGFEVQYQTPRPPNNVFLSDARFVEFKNGNIIQH